MSKIEVDLNVVSQMLGVSVDVLRGIVNPTQPDVKNEDKQ